MDKYLREILACPICKGDLEEKEDKLICLHCCKYYPLKDGIPIMLIDEAQDWNKGKE